MKNQELNAALQTARITETQFGQVVAQCQDETLTSIARATALMAMSKHLREVSQNYRQVAQRTRNKARALREREAATSEGTPLASALP